MPQRIRNQRSLRRLADSRPGFAMIDVIIGTVILGIGLSVVISLAARSLRSQTDGEKRVTASWLADELLSTVLVEGPITYPKLYDNHGFYDYPFQEFEFDVFIEEQGQNVPFRVTATIGWQGPNGPQQIQVQSLISERGGDPYQPRAPKEPVDRMARWYDDEENE
jgi:Tfp pilus assembly protein PilV